MPLYDPVFIQGSSKTATAGPKQSKPFDFRLSQSRRSSDLILYRFVVEIASRVYEGLSMGRNA